jgi:hypothetical protein
MKKCVVMILLLIFCASFAFAYSSDMYSNDMYSNKAIQYQSESRNPWIAVGAAWLVPSLGHAYAGDWWRGFPFLLADVVCIGLIANGVSTDYYGGTTYSSTYTIGLLGFVIARVLEYFDAYATADQYNLKLRRRLGISFTNSSWLTPLKQSDLLNTPLTL